MNAAIGRPPIDAISLNPARQALMPDRLRGMCVQVKVPALDRKISRDENLVASPRPQHSAIIADPDAHPLAGF